MSKEYGPIGHYLLNAYLAWFYENNISPINIVVNATANVSPLIRGKADAGGKLILNIAPAAVRELIVDKDGVSFKTSFGGVSHHVYLQLSDVIAVVVPIEGVGGVNVSIFNYQEMNKLFNKIDNTHVTVKPGVNKDIKTAGLKLVKK